MNNGRPFRCRLRLVRNCWLWSLLGLAGAPASSAPAPPPAGDYVVLLHGLGRTARSMKRLEWTLTKSGYRVINLGYPSRRLSIDQLARDYLPAQLARRLEDPNVRVHFVTHSLGGIVVRQYLALHAPSNLGRVVMLAPPNAGSEVADRFKPNRLFQRLAGPAALELGTGPSSVPNRLGPAGFEVGIIAGDRSWNPLFSAWIAGPDDGTVSVRSTRLAGMRDFLVVHHTHTWLMCRRDVVQAVARFLRTGRFSATPARVPGISDLRFEI